MKRCKGVQDFPTVDVTPVFPVTMASLLIEEAAKFDFLIKIRSFEPAPYG